MKRPICGKSVFDAGVCALWVFCCWFLTVGNVLASDASWNEFVPPTDPKFDWIQLKSGEWLKGKLHALYNFELEFDSDELGLQDFDFADVKRIRTHGKVSVFIEGEKRSDLPIVVEGYLELSGDRVTIVSGNQSWEYRRSQLLTIGQSSQKERDLWTGELTLGANLKGGNTSSIDANVRASAKRRTATSRFELDYTGNYSQADQEETSNNQRLGGFRDALLSKEIFWRQMAAEYFRDAFKNIDYEASLYTSLGYHLIFTPKTEWDVLAGVGGRYTKYLSVLPGENIDNVSPAFGAGMRYDTEMSKTLDLLVEYNFQIVQPEAGSYTHHFTIDLAKDIAADMDLDISFVWDRIDNPQAESDGVVPKKNDYQLILGFSVEY